MAAHQDDLSRHGCKRRNWRTLLRLGGGGRSWTLCEDPIEYGDMQLICEAYHLLKDVLGMGHEEMTQAFEEWNKTELDSFLIELTANILKFQDTDGKNQGQCRAEGHREVDGHLSPRVWHSSHPHGRSRLCPVPIVSEG